MMIQIELLNNRGKKWLRFEDDYVKGFAFDGEKLLSEELLHKAFIEAILRDRLKETLLRLNGNFSAVIHVKQEIYLIADKLRCYPLLFIPNKKGYMVTDQAQVILDKCEDLKFNERAVCAYIACGYLHDDMTLLEECRIVKAGSYVKIDNKGRAISCLYHRHIYEKKTMDKREIIEQGIEAMDRAFLRMLRSIGNYPIVIPLSGGYDSRLLACLCKKFDVPNVSCYTYGGKGSYEVAISKEVARRLGFPWYFVEYTPDLKIKTQDSPEANKYRLFAMNLNTIPHFQDYIAFRELRMKNIVPGNAIVVPGHSGDVLGGSHIPHGILRENKSIAQLIFQKYFTLNALKNRYRQWVISDLGSELNQTFVKIDYDYACSLFDNWNIQSRQANFIVNSVRIYEYLGNDWRIPLWDDDLSRFWLSVDYAQKEEQNLYNEYMFKGYFEPLGVDIQSMSDLQIRLLSKISLPFGMKDYIKYQLCLHSSYFRRRYDPNNSIVCISSVDTEKSFVSHYLKYWKYKENALAALSQLNALKRLLGL